MMELLPVLVLEEKAPAAASRRDGNNVVKQARCYLFIPIDSQVNSNVPLLTSKSNLIMVGLPFHKMEAMNRNHVSSI
jgi:hypothetical protein